MQTIQPNDFDFTHENWDYLGWISAYVFKGDKEIMNIQALIYCEKGILQTRARTTFPIQRSLYMTNKVHQSIEEAVSFIKELLIVKELQIFNSSIEKNIKFIENPTKKGCDLLKKMKNEGIVELIEEEDAK